MKGLSQGTTLVSWSGPEDGYFTAQLGIDNVLSIPFSFPASHLDKMSGEEALGQYLERQARTVIDRYGDARDPRPDSIATEAEQLAYQEVHG